VSDYIFDNASVAVRHLPDPDSGPFTDVNQARAAGHDVLDPKTGVVQIGVTVDGAFFPLEEIKAGLFFQQLEAGRQAQADRQAAQQQQSGAAPDTVGQPQQQSQQQVG
jgi:hypothetical protein